MTDPTRDDQPVRWTCPFCPLLCDQLGVRVDAGGPSLVAGMCAHARRGLAQFSGKPANAVPSIDGQACSLDEALAMAARVLSTSRQPLFGGLGTDVAGARALYRLACRTGAICDAAQGAALMQGVRAQQDRGGYSTTLGEIRTRADVIVCLGGVPALHGTCLFERCGLGEPLLPARHVVVIGATEDDAEAMTAIAALPGITTESLPLQGDLFETAALLAGCVASRVLRDVPAAWQALAARLASATYGVIVGATGLLPPHGALIIESLSRTVATLNLKTRAASLWLGSGDGAGTVNEVFTWLSGLPLRSRAGPLGLEHEPLCFDADRLWADGAVDALLWLSTFDERSAPPDTTLPLILIGHPGLVAASTARVFIPTSTPGIGSPGHLFRSDGGVVLALEPLYEDVLPTAAHVVERLTEALRA